MVPPPGHPPEDEGDCQPGLEPKARPLVGKGIVQKGAGKGSGKQSQSLSLMTPKSIPARGVWGIQYHATPEDEVMSPDDEPDEARSSKPRSLLPSPSHVR